MNCDNIETLKVIATLILENHHRRNENLLTKNNIIEEDKSYYIGKWESPYCRVYGITYRVMINSKCHIVP